MFQVAGREMEYTASADPSNLFIRLRGISRSLKTQDYESNSYKTSYAANPDQFQLMQYPEAQQANFEKFVFRAIGDPDAGFDE